MDNSLNHTEKYNIISKEIYPEHTLTQVVSIKQIQWLRLPQKRGNRDY